MDEITKKRATLFTAFVLGSGVVLCFAYYLFGCAKEQSLDPAAIPFGAALVSCVREAGTRDAADDCRADVERRYDGGKVE